MKNELIYIATPYSDTDFKVSEERFNNVSKYAGKLMQTGKYVFSPISHSHPIALNSNLPKDWLFWEKYDTIMMECCSHMVVLMQPGWEKSTGIKEEIKIANKLGIDITYTKG